MDEPQLRMDQADRLVINTDLIVTITDFAKTITKAHTHLSGHVAGPLYHDAPDFPELICAGYSAHFTNAGDAMYCTVCDVSSLESHCWMCGGHVTKSRPLAWLQLAQRTESGESNYGYRNQVFGANA